MALGLNLIQEMCVWTPSGGQREGAGFHGRSITVVPHVYKAAKQEGGCMDVLVGAGEGVPWLMGLATTGSCTLLPSANESLVLLTLLVLERNQKSQFYLNSSNFKMLKRLV